MSENIDYVPVALRMNIKCPVTKSTDYATIQGLEIHTVIHGDPLQITFTINTSYFFKLLRLI